MPQLRGVTKANDRMSKPKAKTLNDALKGHDPDTIIRDKIEIQFSVMLARGPEEWDEESVFCSKENADISIKQITPYREIYKSHVVTAPGRRDRAAKILWFADPKVASRFREKTKKPS